MSLSKRQADAQLAEIDDVVRRVKQSRIYRVAGDIAIVWGGLQIAQFAVFALAPDSHGWTWLVVDALGVGLTLLMLRRAGVGGGGRIWRALGAFALFYGFGFIWSGLIGHFGPREMALFWPLIALVTGFGYILCWLWMRRAG